MAAQLGLMAAMTAQNQAHMMQHGALTMAEAEKTHQQNMMQTKMQSERARANQAQEFMNQLGADQNAKMKSTNQTLGQSASA
jgi:hypothetical protein